jgi:hypothetical protein
MTMLPRRDNNAAQLWSSRSGALRSANNGAVVVAHQTLVGNSCWIPGFAVSPLSTGIGTDALLTTRNTR